MGIPIKSLENNFMKKISIEKLKLIAIGRPLWIASFLCGYFPDPTRFEPFFNLWVVNGYNKIPRLETKFSGATNLSQIFLDKMFTRPMVTIPHQNQLTKIELSSQPIINAIAVLRATSGCEYCNKKAFEGGALSRGHGFDR